MDRNSVKWWGPIPAIVTPFDGRGAIDEESHSLAAGHVRHVRGRRLPTGCLLLWGHNPANTYLAQATAIAEMKARGAALVVVDPRRAGAAGRADQWLRVRPGTDGALALGLAGVMIAEGWYDRDFIRDWSNGPLLVRNDSGRFLTAADLDASGAATHHVAQARGLVRSRATE